MFTSASGENSCIENMMIQFHPLTTSEIQTQNHGYYIDNITNSGLGFGDFLFVYFSPPPDKCFPPAKHPRLL